jgi:hypothetical protein
MTCGGFGQQWAVLAGRDDAGAAGAEGAAGRQVGEQRGQPGNRHEGAVG